MKTKTIAFGTCVLSTICIYAVYIIHNYLLLMAAVLMSIEIFDL